MTGLEAGMTNEGLWIFSQPLIFVGPWFVLPYLCRAVQKCLFSYLLL